MDGHGLPAAGTKESGGAFRRRRQLFSQAKSLAVLELGGDTTRFGAALVQAGDERGTVALVVLLDELLDGVVGGRLAATFPSTLSRPGRGCGLAQGLLLETGYGIGNESTVWLSTLKPGWSWERNIQPSVPFTSCPLHHREYVVSGRIRYESVDSGETVEAGPGSYLDIEPGHLASVVGDEPAVLIDFDERFPED